MTATDPDGNTVTQTFEVTVTEPEAAWYLPPVSDAVRQGFVRVLNHSDAAGEASITATDDAGVAYEPLTLALGARAVAAFNSDDLESGNAAKGLTGATGMGTGGWRLAIESETLDIEALAYIRTTDGFVTGMNAVAPREDGALVVPIFNPGSNVDQLSMLRLVNPGRGGSGGDGDRRGRYRHVAGFPGAPDAAGGKFLHGGRGAARVGLRPRLRRAAGRPRRRYRQVAARGGVGRAAGGDEPAVEPRRAPDEPVRQGGPGRRGHVARGPAAGGLRPASGGRGSCAWPTARRSPAR